MRSDAHTINTVGIQAPIFYDSNTPSYYLDPAGTSNLYNLNIAGTLSSTGTIAATTATRLATSRSFTLGSITAKSFDGTGNVIWTATEVATSHTHNSFTNVTFNNITVNGYATSSTTADFSNILDQPTVVGLTLQTTSQTASSESGLILKNTLGVTGFLGTGQSGLVMAGTNTSYAVSSTGRFYGYHNEGDPSVAFFTTETFSSLNPTTVRGPLFRSTDSGNGFGIIFYNRSTKNKAYFGVRNAAQIVGDLGVIYATNGNHNWLINTATRMILSPIDANYARLDVTGDIYASRNMYINGTTPVTSDVNFKNISGTISNPLEKINRLTGFYFTFNELAKKNGFVDERQQAGLSAQELQEVFPEVVVTTPFNRDINGNELDKGYLGVEYQKIIPLLIEGIKEQTKRIENLEKIIAELIK